MEYWKQIEEYPLYEISNLGRIRSYQSGKATYLKPQENSRGYYRVQLRNGETKKRFFIHRLVATAFIPNPNNKPHINHIDNCPHNNSADNLEWVTPKENSAHCIKQNRNKRTKVWLEHLHKSQEPTYKPVACLDPITKEVVKVYEKLNDVTNDGYQPSCVSNCCKGKRHSHAGFEWKYAADIRGEL